MKNILNILTLLLLAAPFQAFSQSEDFQVWGSVSFEKKFTARWSARAGMRVKLTENALDVSSARINLGGTYRFNKYFSASAYYNFVERKVRPDYFLPKHQFRFDAEAKKSLGDFRLSYRCRMEMEYRDVHTSENGLIPSFTERNRFTLKYKSGSTLDPFLSYEIYVNLSGPDKYLSNRSRYYAGFSYELNKVNDVSLYFLYEDNYQINYPLDKYVIGFNFSHTIY
ncbi:MAG: DUF2490 domain-containing protein [Flavobacteriales bacterium]